MTYTWRTTGPWGTGKGSNLTEVEFDQNFYDTQLLLDDAASKANVPVGISKIMWDDYYGKLGFFDASDNLIGYFYYPPTDTYHRYGYLPEYIYGENNLLILSEDMYLVLQEHVAGSSFDPNLSDTEGPFFAHVWGRELSVDIPFFLPGNPGIGVNVGADICTLVISFIGVLSSGVVNAREITGELEATISLNGSPIGDIQLGGTEGNVVNITPTGVSIGDILSISAFDVKENASDVSITFSGTQDE